MQLAMISNAEAMQQLAEIAEQAYEMAEKYVKRKLEKAQMELIAGVKEMCMWGWGYKPKLNPAAKTAFRRPIRWFRTRSFCVRSPYG